MNNNIVEKKTRVLIVGTGAIGGYYGGRLSEAGCHVTVVCRSDYSNVYKNGIEIKSIKGDFLFKPHQVLKECDDYKETPDFIIVTTKALPGIDVPKLIKRTVHRTTAVLVLQNGIDIEKPVYDHFPENDIISGLAYISVVRTGPGKIHHTANDRLVIGKYPAGKCTRVGELRDMFTSAGIECETSETILSPRWQKLIWNIPFNAISVIGNGLTTTDMMSNTFLRDLIKKTMGEVMAIADKAGYPQPDNTVDNYMELTETIIDYKTSMLLDYENKRPMEIEAILGNTLSIANSLAMHVPYTDTLYLLLSSRADTR